MKHELYPLLISLMLILALGALGCGSSLTDPVSAPADQIGAQSADTGSQDSAAIMGIYDVTFDPDSMSLESTEVRDAQTHYNITPFLSGHVVFNLIGFDPLTRILDFEMQITNPSALDVYDVRGLFLSPSISGYSLMEADDYTKLFSPFPPDVVNPFKAYAKSTPDRIFKAGATHGQKYRVKCPVIVTLPLKFRMLIECSWPSNCEEPYLIDNQALSNPISTIVHGTISMDVFDHQKNAGPVSVDTTPITGGLTSLTNTSGDTWSADIFNSTGAPAGTYKCLISAETIGTNYAIYDFVDIEVIPWTPTSGWGWVDYPLPGDVCSMDLGVIADPGGPRDSNILMAGNGELCSTVNKYAPYYTVSGTYVDLVDYDPNNAQYQPYPVLRIDASNDGAFSFTNTNSTLPYPNATSNVYNNQIWSAFDNVPYLHMGPDPNEGRYYFDYWPDAKSYPVDVCNDFDLGQYALFTTGASTESDDLIFIGTTPSSYTHDKVKFLTSLDPWIGIGDGLVDPGSIYGIDVYSYKPPTGGPDVAMLYILEDSGGMQQVEVLWVVDTGAGWDYDMVGPSMTINISYLTNLPYPALGHDIELLPIHKDYQLNPHDPVLCVLISWYVGPVTNGEVLLYNANTGAFIESIGSLASPSLPNCNPKYLDTDDDNWEIHVTRYDSASTPLATVFTYY